MVNIKIMKDIFLKDTFSINSILWNYGDILSVFFFNFSHYVVNMKASLQETPKFDVLACMINKKIMKKCLLKKMSFSINLI